MKLIAAVIYMCMSGIGCSQYSVEVESKACGAKYHGKYNGSEAIFGVRCDR